MMGSAATGPFIGRVTARRNALVALVASDTLDTLDTLHIWTGQGTSDAVAAWTEAHLEASRACVAQTIAVTGARTVENTLAPFDRAQWHLRMAGSQTGVMFMVHPEAAVRDKRCRSCRRRSVRSPWRWA